MKIEPGKRYKTRDGSKVRIYATDGKPAFPIHGAVMRAGDWDSRVWCADGSVVPLRYDPWDIVEEDV